MSPPNVQLWALPRAGEDTYLPDVGDYTISRVAGEIGTIQFDYPSTGINFELVREVGHNNHELEVEVRTDGTSENAERAILMVSKGDDIAPGAVWQISGYFLGILMRAAVTVPEETGENGDSVFSGTAGHIMVTLMQRAQARGALTDIDFSSFSETHDSAGDPWDLAAAVKFSPGRDYASILQELENELQMCEWEVTSARQLRMYNPGSRGVDRTEPGPNQVTLEYGRDLGDGPVAGTVEEAGTVVLAAGAEGYYSEAENTTAEAQRGRRIEVFKDFNSLNDQGALDAITQKEAGMVGQGASSQTHALVLGPDSPVPGRHFGLSDWVLRAVRGRTTPERVAQYVWKRTGGEVSATVTLGNLISAQEVKTRQMIERLANGSGVVGTSIPTPGADDGKRPAAPTGLVASSVAYYDGGAPTSVVTAGWQPVVTNEDGTGTSDLQGYEVWYRFEPGQDLPDQWQLAGLTSDRLLTWSPVPAGRIIHIRVLAFDMYGNNSEWSTEYVMTTASDAAAPPVPSTPIASNYIGILAVEWDGKGSAGEGMPDDFREVEIHISTTGAGFEPDRPDNGVDGSTTYVDRLTGPGVYPTALGSDAADVEYFVKLVAVDSTGNASAASAASSATPGLVEDGDVRELNVGKLRTGILTALMTIAGIIRTGLTGARVELDSTGLRCIAADGRILLEFNIPTSVLTVVGRLIAGPGIGVGATVQIDPGPPPAIRLYPDGTTKRYRLSAQSTERPDGSTAAGIQLASFDADGDYDGFSLESWSTNLWMGFREATGWVGPRLVMQRLGGLINLGNGNGGMQIDSNGRFFIASNVDIEFGVPPGAGNGFSFKAQNGDGDGYRMYSDGTYLRFIQNDGNVMLNDPNGPGGKKCFVIPHPVDADRWLVHACLEGPTADVIYRGEAEIVDGQAVVELPSYFEAATRPGGRQVQVTVQLPDEPLRQVLDPPPLPRNRPLIDTGVAEVVPEFRLLPRAAASVPRDGRFRISCDGPDGTHVAWVVTAVRADVQPFDPEPLHTDVAVHGDGPYRYLTPRAA